MKSKNPEFFLINAIKVSSEINAGFRAMADMPIDNVMGASKQAVDKCHQLFMLAKQFKAAIARSVNC